MHFFPAFVNPVYAVVTLLATTISAHAFHGEAITLRPADDVEIILAFDPEDADQRGYIASPYGFLKDAIDVLSANAGKLADLTESITVFFDFSTDGDLIYTVSRESDGAWQPGEQVSYGKPADLAFIVEVICQQVLAIDCSDESYQGSLAFDDAELTDTQSLPFISFGPFPTSPSQDLNIFLDDSSVSNALDIDESGDFLVEAPSGTKYSGTVQQSIDYLVNRSRNLPETELNAPGFEQEVPVPFEEESSLEDRLEIAPGFDPRLRYVVVHCTGPGIMSAAQVQRYADQGKRNKGHGYIMMDGSYIAVASIAENPNVTYATKTETCLRSEAFGTMFNIELNYHCDWRPAKTGSPSGPMLDRLADVIVWVHDNIGPLGIVAHTYVDMGLVDGHTDPQDSPGFDWSSLYARIEARGGNLANISVVDPEFAKQWPVSRTDRAHRFPPIVSGALPSGRDQCRSHANQ